MYGLVVKFDNLKIRSKITTGFLLLLSGVFVLSTVAIVAVNKIGHEFDAVLHSAHVTEAVGEIEATFLSYRRLVREYAVTGVVRHADAAAKVRPILETKIEDGLSKITNPEFREKLLTIQGHLKAYSKDFDIVIEKRRDEDTKYLKRLELAGSNAQDAAHKLVVGRASGVDNSEAIRIGNSAIEQLTTARLNVSKVLGRRQLDKRKAVYDALRKLDASLAEMEGVVTNSYERKELSRIRSEAATFREVFNMALSSATVISDLVDGQMLQKSAFVAGNLKTIKKRVHDIERGLEVEAHKVVSISTAVLVFLTVAGIFFGIVLSHLIGRRISIPVSTITNVLRKISSGDKSVEIPYMDRLDEVGDNARAAQVFKQNLIQVEEQLAALSNMSTDVRKMVDSVREGDLSVRVSEEASYEEARAVARGVNDLTSAIDQVLVKVLDALAGLARGDLSVRMEGDYSGHFLKLKNDLNATCEQLSTVVQTIASSSINVKDATDDIANGISDLSVRTDEQASAIEETSVSLEELAATVSQNADNAEQAKLVAKKATGFATEGGSIAEDAVAAMREIEESSNRITEVVVLIEDIAFQTNILALNAAVEAARAGEAGRGFAVVAGEVRALSQRAGQALNEVKTLVSQSNVSIDKGVELVNRTGESLTEISTSVANVSTLMTDIAEASREQARGVEQVNQTSVSMEEMTQKNAALVDQTTAAMRSTKYEIEALKNTVDFFGVEDMQVAMLAKARKSLKDKDDAEFRPQVQMVNVPADKFSSNA